MPFFVWVSRCRESFLASRGVRRDALPQTGRLLCGWRKGKVRSQLILPQHSSFEPPVGKKKSIWKGGCPKHPPKWHAKGRKKRRKKKGGKSGKIEVDVSPLPRLIRALLLHKRIQTHYSWNQAETVASWSVFRYTQIIYNLLQVWLLHYFVCNVHSRLG